jgi:hypothetical protein
MLRHPSSAPYDLSHVENPAPGTFFWWVTPNRTLRCERSDYRLANEDFGHALLARASHNYQHRRNHEGEIWVAGTKALTYHESLEEKAAVLRLDYLYPIDSIAGQPMCIIHADGQRAYPDYFARYRDGSAVVYEVKALSKITPEVLARFRRTAGACATVGWQFRIVIELDRVSLQNLEWIARYKHSRYAPEAQRRAEILGMLSTPTPLTEVAALIDPESPPRSIHLLFNLMWHRDILFDGAAALDSKAILWRGDSRVLDHAVLQRDPVALPEICTSTILTIAQLERGIL